MKSNKVLLIGDFCIDEYIYGKVTRINPEAPTPVFVPKYTSQQQGMAGNVSVNLTSLGVDVVRHYSEAAINYLRPPHVKRRFVDEQSNYILLRVDEEKDRVEYKLSYIQEVLNDDFSIIAVSDYNKGSITEDLLGNLGSCDKKVFIDTKKIVSEGWAKNVFVLKINEREYEDQIKSGGRLDLVENVIVTLGANGCKLFSYGKEMSSFPTQKKDITCVTGAGDVFFASLIAAYLRLGDLSTAVPFALADATNSVTSRGTGIYSSKPFTT